MTNVLSLPARESFLNESELPLVVEPADASATARSKQQLRDYVEQSRDEFERSLIKYGAVLFRGFAIESPDDFSEMLELFVGSSETTSYAMGGGNKSKIFKNVYTSTETPPRFRIVQHNELSYTPTPPRYVLFYCDVEPEHGGETPLACSRRMYNAMDPEVREMFERHDGIKYIRYNRGRFPLRRLKGNPALATWQEIFEVDSREAVEEICRSNNIECHWDRRNGLQTKVHLPATRKHPVTGEDTWFNQIHMFNPTAKILPRADYFALKLIRRLVNPERVTHARFGDETPISDEVVDRINEGIDSVTIKFPWRQNDLLVVDNLACSHGRMPYRGRRRILAGMK